LWTAYLALFGAAAVTMLGVTVMVEMLYHIKLNEALGPHMTMLGVSLNTRSADSWTGAVLLVVTGGLLFDLVRREFSRQWEQIQEDIEVETRRRAAH
jgi:branched-chain amino acid transport system permease protein